MFPSSGSSPFQNMPGAGSSPPPPTSGNPLLGATQSAQPMGPTPDQRVAGYMDQIRNLHLQIDALATQFPSAADELGKAKQSLADSMSKVAAAMTQPDSGPGPQTF